MVSIGFAGDFCPWKRMESTLLNEVWQESLSDVKPFFDKNDLNIINLECPLTNADVGIVKTGPYLKALPDTAKILKWLKCDLVATANNHFKDYGEAGMRETYEALVQYDIDWLGSGKNFREASEVKIKDINGLRFAFINMAENEWTTTFGDEYGCNPLDPVVAFNSILAYKSNVDFVVMILHGGHEHYSLPSPRMKKLYRYFIDVGADAVISHHTHIVSGYEVYKGKPIFYSLGNFCFDWVSKRNDTWNIGMLLRLKFLPTKQIEFEYVFVDQNNDEPGVKLTPADMTTELNQKLMELNSVIDNDSLLEQRFVDYVSSREKVTMAWLQPNRILTVLFRKDLIPDSISMEKKILLTNLVRCESHRDVLLEVLKRNSNS